ncbi:MAG: hypothetical protein IKO30_06180 [Lachnospiraceae bacterium]|nr:hypothetical protein [Lachnospiraceae bacterium]
MAKIKKKNNAEQMINYTYRDIGQEYLMKKKTVRAVTFSLITFVALLVFIALYIEETKEVQRTYRREYRECLETVSEDIKYYQNAEGDFEFRYRHLVADMCSANSFAVLINDFTDEQKAIGELYTVFLKYPEQMKEKLAEAKQGIDDILANLDKGYDEIRAVVDSIDLKGY